MKNPALCDLAPSSLQARCYRAAAGFEGTAQVAVVQFSRCFITALTWRNVEVPEFDIAIAEDLEDAGAGISRHLEGFVLTEAAWRIRQADSLYLH